ncbi:MAG: Sec-independent protein translocase protein TatA [Herpetosiphonaceae bacterium]|nr:MAG: Sec-independent protein translocase protein TatA [Herpetosiphonaceae bacterium]
MGNLGATELLIILLIVVVIFGASRLADVGGALGKGIREFRRSVRDDENEKSAPPTQEPPR